MANKVEDGETYVRNNLYDVTLLIDQCVPDISKFQQSQEISNLNSNSKLAEKLKRLNEEFNDEIRQLHNIEEKLFESEVSSIKNNFPLRDCIRAKVPVSHLLLKAPDYTKCSIDPVKNYIAHCEYAHKIKLNALSTENLTFEDGVLHDKMLKYELENQVNKTASKKLSNRLPMDVLGCEMKKIYEFKAKSNFRPNTRYINKSDHVSISNEFEIFPNPVVFVDYETNRYHQKIIKIKNVSKNSRIIRFIPPATPYFCCKAVSEGSISLVAPGMDLRLAIGFIPDSLRNFDDILLIEIQGLGTIDVYISGRRVTPVLDLKESIFVGHVLINDSYIHTVNVTNKGNHGRFWILGKDHWEENQDYENLVNSENSDNLELNCEYFTIYPNYFELPANSETNINLTFNPKDKMHYKEDLVLVCDNHTTKNITVEGFGEIPACEIKEAENILYIQDNDLLDAAADCFIKIRTKHRRDEKIYVQNISNVVLKYCWAVQRQQCYTKSHDTMIYEDSPFQIDPLGGVLNPREVMCYTITYAPPLVGEHKCALQLTLLEIPIESNNNNVSRTDMKSLRVGVIGEREEINCSLQPLLLEIDERILLGTKIGRTIKVFNNNDCKVSYKWERIADDSCEIQMTPECGEIEPWGVENQELEIIGRTVAEIERKICAKIENRDKPLELPIFVKFKDCEISLSTHVLDFGNVRFTNQYRKSIEISNLSELEANWVINEKSYNTNIIKITPNSGRIPPFGGCEVQISFLAQNIGYNEEFIEFYTDPKEKRILKFVSHVIEPCIIFNKSYLHLEDWYVGIPRRFVLQIINKTPLKTQFKFDNSICEFDHLPSLSQPDTHNSNEARGAEVDSLSCLCQSGTLNGNETRGVEFTITIHTTILVQDCYIMMTFDNNSQTRVNITGEVMGLDLSCRIDENDWKSLTEIQIDHFPNHAIGEFSSRSLQMRNNTAIRSTFTAEIERFNELGSSNKTLCDDNPDLMKYVPKFRGNQTAKKFSSKTLNGIYFGCSPDSGILREFEVLTLTIHVLSDMWGHYEDILLLKFENLNVIRIPLSITVLGTPLLLPMFPNLAKLRKIQFGQQIVNSGPQAKEIRIKNMGVCDIKLQLTLHQIDYKELTDIKKLFDFKILQQRPLDYRIYKENNIFPVFKSPKRLSLTSTSYFGKPTDIAGAFELSTREMTILSGQTNKFNVTFDLPKIEARGEFYGVVVGYMTLDPPNLKSAGIHRKDGYDVEPLILYVCGSTTIPHLHLGKNCAKMKALAGNCINNGKIKKSVNFTEKIRLKNCANIGLVFKISTNSPFSCNENVTHFVGGNDSIELNYDFTLKNNMLVQKNRALKSVAFDGSLRIEYDNRASQNILVTCAVYMSFLEVSKRLIEFGEVLLGSSQSIPLRLRNDGQSSTIWKINYETDNNDVIKINRKSGEIEGTHVVSPMVVIMIEFSPIENVKYSKKFSVVDKLTKREIVFEVTGSGSYNKD